MKSSDVRLVPIPQSNFEELQKSAKKTELKGSIIGDPNAFGARAKTIYTCKCDKFDLANEQDRIAYAELLSKCLSGAEYDKLWEKQLPVNDGNLVIYVCYAQYITSYEDSKIKQLGDSPNEKDI